MFWPFNHYPGSDYETFNYDWIIGKLKELKDSVTAAKASEDAAKASEDAAAESEQAAHASEEAAADSQATAKQYADNMATLEGQVQTNTSRIDNLVANAGDTDNNAELLDIRTGFTGRVYDTAGNEVRGNDLMEFDMLESIHNMENPMLINEITNLTVTLRESVPVDIPAGTRYIVFGPITTDATVGTTNLVNGLDGGGNTIHTKQITRSGDTDTWVGNAVKAIQFYASDNYSDSTGKTATIEYIRFYMETSFSKFEKTLGVNLCGQDNTKYYPLRVAAGDVLTMSTASGTYDANTDYNEIQFFDEDYNMLNNFGLIGAKRTITLDSRINNTKYVKWLTSPTQLLQLEFGPDKTPYHDYHQNIFNFNDLDDRLKTVEVGDNSMYYTGPLDTVAVMTYNVGEWYDGTRTEMPANMYQTFYDLQNEMMSKNFPSVFLAQEYYYQMYPGATNARTMFLEPHFKYIHTDSDTLLTLGKALGTNLPLVSTEMVNFTNPSGVAQKWQKAYIYINGKKVCIANVHLSQVSQTDILDEVDEIVAAIATEPYFIVAGDFNTRFNGNDQIGAQVLSKFAAIGATPCNAGAFGTFYTYRGSEAIGTSNEANDNIFVSSGITIKNVYMDDTKIQANLPIQDHVPLIAYLTI